MTLYYALAYMKIASGALARHQVVCIVSFSSFLFWFFFFFSVTNFTLICVNP